MTNLRAAKIAALVLLPSALLAADDALIVTCGKFTPCQSVTVPPSMIVHIPDRTERDCYQVFAREILEDGKHYGFDIHYGRKVDCASIGEKPL